MILCTKKQDKKVMFGITEMPNTSFKHCQQSDVKMMFVTIANKPLSKQCQLETYCCTNCEGESDFIIPYFLLSVI